MAISLLGKTTKDVQCHHFIKLVINAFYVKITQKYLPAALHSNEMETKSCENIMNLVIVIFVFALGMLGQRLDMIEQEVFQRILIWNLSLI